MHLYALGSLSRYCCSFHHRQQLQRLGAHAHQMTVWRGSATIKQIPAKEFAEAGGRLAPEEKEALVGFMQISEPALQLLDCYTDKSLVS